MYEKNYACASRRENYKQKIKLIIETTVINHGRLHRNNI